MNANSNNSPDASQAYISQAYIAVYRAPAPGVDGAPAEGPPLSFHQRYLYHLVRTPSADYDFYLDTLTLPLTSLPLFYDVTALCVGAKPQSVIFMHKSGGGGALSERAPGTGEFFQALIDDLADFPQGWTHIPELDSLFDYLGSGETDARTA
jgi:hypothetical protein